MRSVARLGVILGAAAWISSNLARLKVPLPERWELRVVCVQQVSGLLGNHRPTRPGQVRRRRGASL